jgi:arginase
VLSMLVLPWHLTDRLADDLNLSLPDGARAVDAAPGESGDPWRDLAALYRPLRDAVAAASPPQVILSGDCVTALAVLAGVQARGLDPSLVWIDAHGDFHTEASTTSGYLGGLPLAKAVGRGDLSLPEALDLRPLPEARALIGDGRDLDPPEVDALRRSSVRRAGLGDLGARLPHGAIHLHVDLDVIDPSRLPGLRFPAPGGTDPDQLRAAIAAVAAHRPLAAVSIAATWAPERSERARNDAALEAVLHALPRAVAV